jgi:subtilisin family serine protease
MVKNKYWTTVFFSIGVFCVEAQVNRYMVFFKDKANSPYSISEPQQFLSQRSLERREKNNVSVTTEDLPVNVSYINQVKSAGATSLYATRWLNGLLIQCDATLIPTLQNLGIVSRIELVAPGSLPQGRSNTTSATGRQSSTNTVKTTTQLNMLGIDAMHALNYRGEGVKVAVFDSGFPGVNTQIPFAHLQDNIVDTYNFANKQTNVYKNDNHGTEVLSVMGAFIENSFTGGAYNADYHLYITESVPTEYRVEEYHWLFAAERADSAGVDVINASLGYNTFDDLSMNYLKTQLDGKTATITKAAQLAADRGIIVVVSAGNEGNNSWQLITPPADAEGVIAAASVTAGEVKSSFSSIGPTSDGRIKPDLSAMGSATTVIRENGTIGTASGTSVSSPLLASLAAGLVQANPSVNKNNIVTALKLTASLADSPNNSLGYGVPDFVEANNFVKVITQIKSPVVKGFSVYPNPSYDDKVFLKGNDIVLPGALSVNILNAFGQSLKQFALQTRNADSEYELDLEGLPEGLLLLKVRHSFGSEIFKIIKAH